MWGSADEYLSKLLDEERAKSEPIKMRPHKVGLSKRGREYAERVFDTYEEAKKVLDDMGMLGWAYEIIVVFDNENNYKKD